MSAATRASAGVVTEALASLTGRLAAGAAAIEVGGATEGAWGLLIAALHRHLGAPILVLAADPAVLIDEMSHLSATGRPLLFPEIDALPADRTPPPADSVGARIEVQAALLRGEQPVVVTTPLALMRPTPPPASFRGGLRALRVGAAQPMAELIEWLLAWGYTREPQAEEPGQFAARGGIVDIHQPAGDGPVRIELFGDVVDSIRGYDPESQASVTRRESVDLLPAAEYPRHRVELDEALVRMRALDLGRCLPEVREQWQDDTAKLAETGYFQGLEALHPLLAGSTASLLDYFMFPPVVVVFEPERLRLRATRRRAELEEEIADEGEHGELPKGLTSGLLDYEVMERVWKRRVLVERTAPEGAIDLGWEAPASLAGRAERIGEELEARAEQGPVVVLTQQRRRLEGLLETSRLRAADMEELDAELANLPRGVVNVIEGSLQTGFVLAGMALVYTDRELFGSIYRPRQVKRGAAAQDPTLAFHLDIEVGRPVVHRDHGIGIFQGLRSIADAGNAREYIHLEYAGGDRVFVPVENMDRLQLYIGSSGEDGNLKLSRLGTADWDRTKRKVRRAVAEMADELLQVYAKRESAPGHAFGADGPWQAELEMSFPYHETSDQLSAMDDIKTDMESPRPMDRLLCGDVGFGKTELALRAAFKAAVDGKQVAILVPTTVLAHQHFLTFTERLKPFPVKVEMLSRFRTDAEAAAVRHGLRDGTIDIVIGTHGLLAADVRFKDLGLLVIDEEQRFGVAQKEKLKKLRATVDVLSMSATPIPRTLHMALGGIRDLSVLAVAPEERLPVRTFVTADSDELVRDVAARELQREGQVFFVHNRVRTIRKAADRVAALMPDARLAVAHGQMDERDLAKVMVDFVQRRYDVLVCTTIIESGLDIPTANTILVQDADRFGLADLYQLRGRVGRSANRAYAYFLYDPDRSLTEHADKRLDVIGEYQELGAGFKLALRDLEIRGAGNLLGREQSGEIAAVGLEMYNQMLRSAVAALKGGEAEPELDDLPAVAPLELPIDHFLPHDYVPDEKVRLQVYQELASASTEAQLQTLARRLRDRFGPPPGAVENLMFSLRVKLRAQAAGLSSLALDGDVLELRPRSAEGLDLDEFGRRHANLKARATRLRFGWRAAGDAWRDQLLEVLADLARRPAVA